MNEASRTVAVAAIGMACVAGAAGCGDYPDCPAEVRYAATVQVLGTADYIVEEFHRGEYFECQTSSSQWSQCGGNFLGTFEIRVTTSDGRMVSTRVDSRLGANECGPTARHIVIDVGDEAQ